jgi:hypothetical protein
VNDRQYYSLEALLRSPKGCKGWFAYREVTLEEARRIREKTGLDVRGFIHCIDRDGMNHISTKHVDKKREDESPIAEEDNKKIPQIVETCEAIQCAGITGTGQKAILYIQKNERLIVYIVEEIRIRQKTLMIKTMYKSRRK